MKRNLLIALALVVLFVGGWTMKAATQGWEYKTETSPSEKKLNQLGEEGWELVAVETKGGGASINFGVYVFKRAK